MQVEKINNTNFNFYGRLAPTNALKEFKTSLTAAQKDKFLKQEKIINSLKDNRIYFLETSSDNTGAILYEKDKFNGKNANLTMFTAPKKDTGKLFDLLSEYYKYLAIRK